MQLSKLSESELKTVIEEISDMILALQYKTSIVIEIFVQMLTLDLLSYSYEIREQILYVMCNAVGYYDIRHEIDLSKLLTIRNDVEKDLQEYIDEIINGE